MSVLLLTKISEHMYLPYWMTLRFCYPVNVAMVTVGHYMCQNHAGSNQQTSKQNKTTVLTNIVSVALI